MSTGGNTEEILDLDLIFQPLILFYKFYVQFGHFFYYQYDSTIWLNYLRCSVLIFTIYP